MGASGSDYGIADPGFRLACPYGFECSDLFRQMPAASLVLAPDLRIAAATRHYLDTTMTAEDDLLGRPMFDAFPANPNDPGDTGPRELAASLDRVQRLGTRDRMGLVRYDIPTPDGSFELRYWLPVNAPIFDADGRLRWIVHQVEDVTEYVRLKEAAGDRRLADERLRQDIQALETEVGQTTLALRRELEASVNLLSAASHDLRQPVQAAVLFTSSLKTLPLPEGAAQRIRFLDTSLRAMDRMLSDLLDLSRLEAGKVVPRVVPFCLTDLLERLADEFRPLAEAAGLKFKFGGCPYSACSDPVLLEQMLRNLIANAIKYTAKGAVALLSRKVGGEVRISVGDTGIGIPADQTERIFEDYYQVTSTAQGGLGIGLATVARTAKLLGHRLSLRSKPGGGSIFSVHLPSAEAG